MATTTPGWVLRLIAHSVSPPKALHTSPSCAHHSAPFLPDPIAFARRRAKNASRLTSGGEGSWLSPPLSPPSLAFAPFDGDHHEAMVAMVAELACNNRFAAALELVTALQAAARKHFVPSQVCRLLLLEVDVRVSARQALPDLSPLFKSFTVSAGRKFALPAQHALTVVRFCAVLLILGHAQVAAAALRGALPKVMEHGCGGERGRALLLLSKCHLAQLSEAAKGGSGSGGASVQIAVLRQVLASLQCACRHLTLSLQPSKQRDLAECHYLTARVCAGLAAAITSSSCLQGAAKAPTHTPPPLSGSNEPWRGEVEKVVHLRDRASKAFARTQYRRLLVAA